MNKKSIVVWVVVVVCLWLACWGLLFIPALFISPGQAGLLGSLGDMFGASNALFAGLGFFGLLFVLYHDIAARKVESDRRFEDVKARRESRRPFLTAQLTPVGDTTDAASVVSAGWHARHLSVRTAVELEVENLSDDPALNARVTCSARFGGIEVPLTLEADDMPLVRGRRSVCSMRLAVDGADAENYLAELIANRKIVIDITVDCESLEGVGWRSRVSYELYCNRSGDIELLKRIQAQEDDEAIVEGLGIASGGDNSIALKHRAKLGTWSHAAL